MKEQINPGELLDFLDQANVCTLNILTLADLLSSHHTDQKSEERTVGNTGCMILEEARRLRDLLEQLKP